MDKSAEPNKSQNRCGICHKIIDEAETKYSLAEKKYLCTDCYKSCGFSMLTATNCLRVEDVRYIKSLREKYPEGNLPLQKNFWDIPDDKIAEDVSAPTAKERTAETEVMDLTGKNAEADFVSADNNNSTKLEEDNIVAPQSETAAPSLVQSEVGEDSYRKTPAGREIVRDVSAAAALETSSSVGDREDFPPAECSAAENTAAAVDDVSTDSAQEKNVVFATLVSEDKATNEVYSADTPLTVKSGDVRSQLKETDKEIKEGSPAQRGSAGMISARKFKDNSDKVYGDYEEESSENSKSNALKIAVIIAVTIVTFIVVGSFLPVGAFFPGDNDSSFTIVQGEKGEYGQEPQAPKDGYIYNVPSGEYTVTMAEESSASRGVVTVEGNVVLPSSDGEGYYENHVTVELQPGENTVITVGEDEHIYTSINSIMEFEAED